MAVGWPGIYLGQGFVKGKRPPVGPSQKVGNAQPRGVSLGCVDEEVVGDLEIWGFDVWAWPFESSFLQGIWRKSEAPVIGLLNVGIQFWWPIKVSYELRASQFLELEAFHVLYVHIYIYTLYLISTYIYIYIVVRVDNSPHIHIHIHGSWLEIIFPPQNSPTKIEYGQSCDPFGIQILSHSHGHPNFEPCIFPPQVACLCFEAGLYRRHLAPRR